ncbi:MAG: SIS domain-containing protein [Polyangiaceae bacterium]|nr:SIS domain-containing protein [Polyangiaceae bacterium]
MSDARALAESARRKADESTRVVRAFVDDHADAFARCAADVAARFEKGARLFAIGNGGSACDAQHLAVEFMHPILEKRRALPAVALTTDAALLSAVANDHDFAFVFADQLRALARDGDIVLGISTSGDSPSVVRAFELARSIGVLTIGFAGRDGGRMTSVADHLFVVPSYSIHRIQEAHGVALHLLWDLVQVSLGAEDVL